MEKTLPITAAQTGRLGGSDKARMTPVTTALKSSSELGFLRIKLHSHSVDPALRTRLDDHWQQAQTAGVFGVPTFLVGEEIFWGNDRIDFLAEHLTELGAAR